ncbi:hypothetical protein FPV67DRAFT_1481196 [Lyophyllum atratum]|nr:hypothetical protein FPV67DRAFT_1481196 [Lyophyllum atratum]
MMNLNSLRVGHTSYDTLSPSQSAGRHTRTSHFYVFSICFLLKEILPCCIIISVSALVVRRGLTVLTLLTYLTCFRVCLTFFSSYSVLLAYYTALDNM